MRRSGQPAGFIKVKQREAALAKSHRPLGSLFTEANQFSLVGGEGVGEMLFQATPQALDRLARIIDTKAEATPRMKENKNTGALEPAVSRYRSEVGGVDDIQLYGATDKVRFSAQEAVAWIRQPNVIGGYIVELFRPNRKGGIGTADGLISRLRNSLQGLGGGLLIRPFLPSVQTTQFGQPSLTLSIQLLEDSRRQIELPFLADGRPWRCQRPGWRKVCAVFVSTRVLRDILNCLRYWRIKHWYVRSNCHLFWRRPQREARRGEARRL